MLHALNLFRRLLAGVEDGSTYYTLGYWEQGDPAPKY
jgi:hypothetical protein